MSVKPPDYTFDEDRLAALQRYAILDTPAEPGFDDIVLLASQICETPVALVSLVAADRQWFKARIGFEACETDLDSSVCVHALVEPDLMVIPDLRLDARTKANPLVSGAPFIRFYAGAPLLTPDGAVLGSLCVIDGAPRPQGLSDRQASSLRALARQVMSQLELRRAVAERDAAIALERRHDRLRRDREAQYQALFEAIDDGFCIVEMKFDGDHPVDYRFVEVNPAFAVQTGLEDVQGRWMRDLAPAHEQHWFDIYGRVATTGEPVRFEHAARELGGRWFEVYAFRVGDPAARQVAVLFSDKTDRKLREDQKKTAEETQEVRNRELSHRMKNMLAMVQAIATQSLRGVAERDRVAAFLQRIHALARAHDVLLAQDWSAAQLSDLVEAVLGSFPAAGQLEASGPVVLIGPRASLSVSLLLYEMATNALKYGALSTETGRVAVRWRLDGSGDTEALVLEWAETGGPPVEAPDQHGFGSKLIRMGLIGTGGAELSFPSSGLTARFTALLAQVQQT